jgi:hypothetical protein
MNLHRLVGKAGQAGKEIKTVKREKLEIKIGK